MLIVSVVSNSGESGGVFECESFDCFSVEGFLKNTALLQKDHIESSTEKQLAETPLCSFKQFEQRTNLADVDKVLLIDNELFQTAKNCEIFVMNSQGHTVASYK